jgi:hypothetical protein
VKWCVWKCKILEIFSDSRKIGSVFEESMRKVIWWSEVFVAFNAVITKSDILNFLLLKSDPKEKRSCKCRNNNQESCLI